MPARKISSRSPLFFWLALERIPRAGPLTIARLHDAFGSAEAILQAGSRDISRLTGLSEKLARTIADFTIPENDIMKDLDTLERLEARVITRWDDDYPVNLKEIYDPPALLFVRGEIREEDRRAVAVVGTRHPTRYGIEMTETITRDLVLEGVTLVSGLARGIDTACHQAVLRHQGRTVGVLGCGIDVTYPRENRDLIERMAAEGAVVSEFRPGVPPAGTNFYRRNRIVSGLSKGVVVVEAGRTSGSLITASHAIDQNRDVFAVPGNVMNARSAGPHYLLRQGAGLVESGADIVTALFQSESSPVQASLFEAKPESADVSEIARTVLEALEPDPVPIDYLCQTLHIDAGNLSGILLELELNGLARQHPGKMFSKRLDDL
jgi:DNA processing protein